MRSPEYKHLESLTKMVTVFLAALDAEMKRPGNPSDRPKHIAQLANALELSKDSARYFGLGIDFRTGRKRQPQETKRPRKKAQS